MLTAPKKRVEPKTDSGAVQWYRVVSWCLLAFGVLILGYFIFRYVPVQKMVDESYRWYKTLDRSFLIMLLAGFVAQMVDGALGMGYGVTSATILLSAGVNPAAISGSIHTAEMFASGASGYSHYKFGNVNKKLFKALLIPGVLGAVAGALLLVLAGEKYGKIIRPVIAFYTLLLGIKFILNAFREIKPQKKFRHYRLLAGIGGFFDSFGGGGWGPIVTSTLINNGRSHKYVVGSVSLTEFFVTLASAFTFFTLIGLSHWQTILGLILGGLVAAPIAAKLAGKLPRKTAFLLLGTLVIIWSIRILVKII
ncbi:MAG: sulfite exporter TauE/SafE family protein [Bacteroidetes bacterium]|nr:sulfite exporter TauE/SafE family protein [Bacteroidota bacterium]